MGCANSRVQPEKEETGAPNIVLLKVADLLNNERLLEEMIGFCHLTSYDILQQYWEAQQSIAGLFGPGSFKTVPWWQLKSTEYGVLTYCWGNRETRAWGPTWKEMIGTLEETGKMKVEYVWIGARSPARVSHPPICPTEALSGPACGAADIFCLDQNDPKKMETIRLSDNIYAWANEYHVMGLGTFKRGWCLMELGVTKAPPIIYSQHNGLLGDDNVDVLKAFGRHREAESDMQAALQDLLRYENAGFSVEADRAIVRGFIESAHGDVPRFEAFLIRKVLGLKQLQELEKVMCPDEMATLRGMR